MMISPLYNIGQTLLSGITSKLAGHGGNTPVTSNSTPIPTDQSQISPFAQLMAQLEQLQQQNPAQFKQETAQFASSLQQASATAQANGNTGEASMLSYLANAFQTSSTSGQMPDFKQAPSQAPGASGLHHRHHGGPGLPMQAVGQDLNTVAQNLLSSTAGTTTQQP